MTPPPVLLRHGTTRQRATQIVANGLDPDFVEPHGPRAEYFSTAYADPQLRQMGHPEEYARLKAANFPTEGGPVILEIEVPAWVVGVILADDIGGGLALSGEVRFEPGVGLEELLRVWPSIPKRITPL